MLKRFSCILFFLLIFPVYVSADSIDAPYYLGLVTTDGGTTVNNGAWMEYNEFGHNHPTSGGWDGYWQSDEAQAVRFLSTNGAIAILYWRYDGTPGVEEMVLGDADIFKVTADSLVYYGFHDFEDGASYLFDNPQRTKRSWKTGDTFVLTETLGAVTRTEVISCERKGITAPADATPGASIADCALIHFYEYFQSTADYGMSTALLAPGKGRIWEMNYEFEVDGVDEEIGMDAVDEVTDWGTSVDYPAYMIDDFTAALGILNGLPLSANIVDVKPISNTRVIVIPMN